LAGPVGRGRGEFRRKGPLSKWDAANWLIWL
jgi:hypothetical protein